MDHLLTVEIVPSSGLSYYFHHNITPQTLEKSGTAGAKNCVYFFKAIQIHDHTSVLINSEYCDLLYK